MTRLVPRGPILGIAPFNFPLHLVAHNVAPALAVGTPIIMKPAPSTPLSAYLLGEILADRSARRIVVVLPVANEHMDPLVDDPHLPVISFTGSGPWAGRSLDRVPCRQVELELGGNAAAVLLEDFGGIEFAGGRIATFGTYHAGQSCIPVQRVIAEQGCYQSSLESMEKAFSTLRASDPSDESTGVGPLIDERAAKRIESWVTRAVLAACSGWTRPAQRNSEQICGQTGITGPDTVAAAGFEVVQETTDQGCVEVGQIHRRRRDASALGGRDASALGGVTEQESPGVAVGGDGVWACVALPNDPVGEERR